MSSSVLLFLLLVFLAGGCAGFHQQATVALLARAFGSGPEALSLTLAALCLGGSIGAASVKGPTDRSKRPLALSALFLALAGLFSLCLPLALAFFDTTLLHVQEATGSGPGSQKVLAFFFTFALSLPAVGLFGAFVVSAVQVLRRQEGIVTGAGAALCVLFFGLANGIAFASLLSLTDGLARGAVAASLGLVVFGVLMAVVSHIEEQVPARGRGPAEERMPGNRDRTLLLAGFVGGAAVLMVFLLGRLAFYPLQGGALAASPVFAAAFCGLGFGYLGGVLVHWRPERLAGTIGKALIAGSILAAAVALLFSFGLHLPGFGAALARASDSRGHEMMRALGLGFLVAGLPCVLVGAALPLLSGLAFDRGRTVGDSTGGVLAAIGLGAGTSLLLYTTIVSFTGLQSGIAVAAFALATAGTLLLADIRALACAMVILAGYAVAQPPPLPVFSPTGKVQLLDYQEGPGDGYAVLAEPSARSLAINGYRAGHDSWVGAETLLAHLPLLLSDDPESLLMLGFGAGGALCALREYPDVRRVYALVTTDYLEDGVRRAFGERLRAYERQKKQTVLRFCHGQPVPYLRSESRKWSVILSHLAWHAGAEAKQTAMSSDLLRLVKRRLSRNGLSCLGLPDDTPPGIFQKVVTAFAEAFPEGQVWFLLPGHVVLVGGHGKPAISLKALEERLARPLFAAAVKPLCLDTPEAILGSRVCSISAAKARLAGEAWPTMPNWCLRIRLRELERGLEWGVSTTGAPRARNLQFLAAAVDDTPLDVETADVSLAVRRRNATGALRYVLRGLAEAAGSAGVSAGSSAETEFRKGLEAHPGEPRLVKALEQMSQPVRAAFFPREEDMPSKSEVETPAAGLDTTSQSPVQGGGTERERTTLNTGVPGGEGWSKCLELGEMATRKGDFVRALKEYRAAEQLAPGRTEPAFCVAMALALLGRHNEAIEKYETILRSEPGHVEAWTNKGFCLAALERLEEAEAVYRAVLKEHPDNAVAHYNLATLFKRMKRTEEAFEEYQAALKAREDYPEALFDYAVTLYQEGEHYPALQLLRRFEKLMPNSPQATHARRLIKELSKNESEK
jgi:Tfp pilus assembly protein PilF